MDDYVTNRPTDDLGHVDIEKEQLEGRTNEFDKSLGNLECIIAPLIIATFT